MNKEYLDFLFCENKDEKPLDVIREDGGFTSIFRTLGCIGDSLSSGEFVSTKNGCRVFNDYYEYSWGQYIARKCGLLAYNFSRGGLTAKTFFELARYGHVFTPEKACQAYIIALGVNDITRLINKSGMYPRGFGNLEEEMGLDYDEAINSFTGAYIQIIKKIKDLQPKARIFLVTVPLSENEGTERYEYEEKHAALLRALPDYFDYTYVIDLRAYAPRYTDEFYDKLMGLDGHMSPMGYKFTADMFMSYIDYIIRHNAEDFVQVPFIGKGIHNDTVKW